MTWIPFLIIALDQMSKRIALYFFEHNINFNFFIFKNSIIFNKGISFGLFADSYYSFLLKATIYAIIFLVCYTWFYTKSTKESIAWGLIVGGGISNGFDRIVFGAVLDFIYIKSPYGRSPIFNIADVAITIGGLMLLYFAFNKGSKKTNNDSKIK